MKNQSSEYNRLPKRVSRKEFNRFILPHLSHPVKGPKPKVSLYKIFNYVTYVLSTGCQWERLPVKRNEIHWSNVYKWHNRWSKDGTYLNLLEATVHDTVQFLVPEIPLLCYAHWLMFMFFIFKY